MKQVSIILVLLLVIASIAGPAAAENAYEQGQQTTNAAEFYRVADSGYAAKSPYPGKFYGTVERMPETGWEGIWIINGREVLVTRSTKIEEEHGRLSAGAYVEVEGNYSGKTFTAYEIEVKGESGYREYAPHREKTYKGRSRDYTSFPEKAYNSKFAGTIESIPEGGYEGVWIIDGRKVEVNNKTLIDETDGRVSVGAWTKVRGTRTGDTIIAYEIEIERHKK